MQIACMNTNPRVMAEGMVPGVCGTRAFIVALLMSCLSLLLLYRDYGVALAAVSADLRCYHVEPARDIRDLDVELVHAGANLAGPNHLCHRSSEAERHPRGQFRGLSHHGINRRWGSGGAEAGAI